MMGVFNNLVMFDQHVPQNSLQSIVPDLATELVLERGRHGADLPAAPGRQMARRQAVHRQRRQMHLGPADRQGERKAARQSAQVLVPQPRRGDHQRRLRGHLPSEAAAAGIARAARLRLVAGLSLPCVAARHAQHPIGTGPFKFVEFKPNERDQGDAQPGLLEAGPALSRRHRVYDHPRTCRPRTWPLSPASST